MNFQNEQHHIEDVLNPGTAATPIHRNTPQPTANTNMYRNTTNEVLGNSSKPNVPMQTPKPSLAERLKTPNQIPLILSNSKTQSSSTIHMETPVKSDLGKIQLIPQNLTETPQPSSSVKMSLHERLKNSTSFAQRLNKINPAVSSQTSVSGTPLPTTAKSNANEINPLENKNEKQDEIIIIPSSPLLECNPIKLEQVMIQDNFDDFDEDFEKGLESINVDNLVVASQLSAQAKVEDRLETNKHSVIKQSTPNPNHNYSAKVEMSNMKSVDLNGLSEINNCEFDEFGMDEMEIIQPNKSDISLSQSEKFSSQNAKNINLKPMRLTGKRYNEILSSSPPSNSIKMSKKQKVHVKDTSSNAESLGNLELVSFVDIMQYDGMVQLKGKVKQLKSKLKSDKGVGFWLMVELIDNDQNTLTIKFEDEVRMRF
ncbi:hypothetical protein BC833DRAFT_600523 [Globomyces pollinis-pini]|nr:hypothetical protein BC833DRAFT_600523 [Globomyces pollinis-pini]